LGEFKGGNTGEISQEWELTEPTYKGMIPPSTQNLKALGLQVFIFICCSTFSFLPNVGLRLTLEYLTISLSSESHSSTTLIHSPSSGSNSQTRVHYSWPLTCIAVHTLIRDTLAWNHHQKDFRYRGQTVLAYAANHRLWYHLLGESEEETGEISQEWELSQHIREWHHLQPKILMC